MICKYPMFTPDNQYIGHAGLELRLENLLRPLIQANLEDPIHHFYIITDQDELLTVEHGRITLIT